MLHSPGKNVDCSPYKVKSCTSLYTIMYISIVVTANESKIVERTEYPLYIMYLSMLCPIIYPLTGQLMEIIWGI